LETVNIRNKCMFVLWPMCYTFVIEEHLRRGIAIIPGDMLYDATVRQQLLCAVFVDVDPQ